MELLAPNALVANNGESESKSARRRLAFLSSRSKFEYTPHRQQNKRLAFRHNRDENNPRQPGAARAVEERFSSRREREYFFLLGLISPASSSSLSHHQRAILSLSIQRAMPSFPGASDECRIKHDLAISGLASHIRPRNQVFSFTGGMKHGKLHFRLGELARAPRSPLSH